MEELNRQIGQKIRALRLSRGMTQAALAGDCITRNMLSLIENGSAAPSLHTLTDLAERLEVPVGYFFAVGDEETSQFTKMGMISQLHRLLESGAYMECLAACDTLPRPDDEIRLIRCRCHFALAKAALENGALSTAARCLEQAVAAAEQCIYAPEGFLTAAAYITALIRAAGREEIPPELARPDLFPGTWIETEFFVYIRALLACASDDVPTAAALRESGLIASPVYLDFLDAKLAMAEGDPERAMPILRKLLTASLGFFTRYHVLTALETCSSTAGDFKSAYQYSAQKVHLMENFAK